MKIIISILLLLICHGITAQKQAYKFESPEDSVKYYKHDLLLQKGWILNKKVGLLFFYEDSAGMSHDEITAIMDAIPKYKYLQYKASYPELEEVLTSNRKDTIHSISITGTQHKRIPWKILHFKNLKEIELINTEVRKIPWLLNWSIIALDSLKTVKIYNHQSERPLRFKKNTKIEKLVYRENPHAPQPKNFHKLAKVTELDLVRNDFVHTKNLKLSKFKHLKELNLSHNSIAIADLTEDTVHALSKLVLSFNQLSSVPKEIGYFKNLKKLQLAENKIVSEQIHPALGSLKQLESLSFYKNKLDSLPDFLFQLTRLKEFDIYYNEVELIPPTIGNLKRLEKLYLANNKIYAIPEAIGELKKLTELYLHHNRISYLPANICQLKNITDFHIHNNYFNEFPSCILSFKKLEDLDISFNNITSVPEEIKQLKALQYLWMRGMVFEANSKAEAEAMQNTFTQLQERGVKVSIELD